MSQPGRAIRERFPRTHPGQSSDMTRSARKAMSIGEGGTTIAFVVLTMLSI